MASSCSLALSPSSLRSPTPIWIARLRAPIRTMKNSSRLVRKIDRKRTRARRGSVASSARASTRALNSSQLSWLFKKWSRRPSADSSTAEGRPSRSPASAHSRVITPGEAACESLDAPRGRGPFGHSGTRSERAATARAASVRGSCSTGAPTRSTTSESGTHWISMPSGTASPLPSRRTSQISSKGRPGAAGTVPSRRIWPSALPNSVRNR